MTPGDRFMAPGGEGGETPQANQALRWLRGARAEGELLGEVTRLVSARRRRWRLILASGGCAAMILAGGSSFWPISREIAEPAPTFARPVFAPTTATVIAPSRQTLPDGSLVELKEGAAIANAFTAERRSVTLLRGEAHFQVVKDPARPFVVTAGEVAVRAVGTAFSVQFDAIAVEVLVTEGQVAVEQSRGVPGAGAPLDAAATVKAGKRALIRRAEGEFSPEVSTIEASVLAKRLAWRVPQLEFSRTPLPEIVALMNGNGDRLRRIVVEVPAAELAEMKLSGFLAADNVDGLVRLLEAHFSLVAVEEEQTVRLRKK